MYAAPKTTLEVYLSFLHMAINGLRGQPPGERWTFSHALAAPTAAKIAIIPALIAGFTDCGGTSFSCFIWLAMGERLREPSQEMNEEVMFSNDCGKITVLLVDDHAVTRGHLRRLLEARGFEVLGEANNSMEAVRQCATLRPDVVVLDTSMERSRNLNVMLSARLNSVEATRRITGLCPATRVIMTTLHPDLAYVAESVNAGVSGYILKTKVAESLVDAIRAVTQGAIVLGAGISGTARAV